MTLEEMKKALQGTIIYDNGEEENIEDVVASDLMSDVLVVEKDDEFILLTSLASDQAVRTADIVGAAGVILVNGKNPQPGLKKLAEEMEIPLMSTPRSSFEACIILGRAMGRCQG